MHYNSDQQSGGAQESLFRDWDKFHLESIKYIEDDDEEDEDDDEDEQEEEEDD